MLEEALAAGIAAGGGDAMLGGALPTPAASVLTRRLLRPRRRRLRLPQPLRRQRDKFFGAAGTKLDDESEAAIEALLDAATGAANVRALEGAFDDYIRELRTAFALDLSGMRVALDCANGATYRAAPAVFTSWAEVEAVGDEPDGRNINLDCGSTNRRA